MNWGYFLTFSGAQKEYTKGTKKYRLIMIHLSVLTRTTGGGALRLGTTPGALRFGTTPGALRLGSIVPPKTIALHGTRLAD